MENFLIGVGCLLVSIFVWYKMVTGSEKIGGQILQTIILFSTAIVGGWYCFDANVGPVMEGIIIVAWVASIVHITFRIKK